MTKAQEISESRAAAVDLAMDALETLKGCLPVASPDDLDACATALVLQAAQLRACALEQRKMQAASRPVPAWWQ